MSDNYLHVEGKRSLVEHSVTIKKDTSEFTNNVDYYTLNVLTYF